MCTADVIRLIVSQASYAGSTPAVGTSILVASTLTYNQAVRSTFIPTCYTCAPEQLETIIFFPLRPEFERRENNSNDTCSNSPPDDKL